MNYVLFTYIDVNIREVCESYLTGVNPYLPMICETFLKQPSCEYRKDKELIDLAVDFLKTGKSIGAITLSNNKGHRCLVIANASRYEQARNKTMFVLASMAFAYKSLEPSPLRELFLEAFYNKDLEKSRVTWMKNWKSINRGEVPDSDEYKACFSEEMLAILTMF